MEKEKIISNLMHGYGVFEIMPDQKMVVSWTMELATKTTQIKNNKSAGRSSQMTIKYSSTI